MFVIQKPYRHAGLRTWYPDIDIRGRLPPTTLQRQRGQRRDERMVHGLRADPVHGVAPHGTGRHFAAFCFAGQPRTLAEPAVVRGIVNHLFSAFGTHAVPFFYLTNDDGITSRGGSWGHGRAAENATAVRAAISTLIARASSLRNHSRLLAGTGAWYYGPFARNGSLHPAMRRVISTSSLRERYLGNSTQTRWEAWWDTWEKIRRCFALVRAHEQRHAIRFHWVVRSRPDLWFFASMPHHSTLPANAISFAAGVIGCRNLPCLNDHLAFVPRALADDFFDAALDLSECDSARCATDFVHDMKFEFAHYLHSRLSRRAVPFSTPSLPLPYTLMRPCKVPVPPGHGATGLTAPECFRLTDVPFPKRAGLTAARGVEVKGVAEALASLRALQPTCYCKWLNSARSFCTLLGTPWERRAQQSSANCAARAVRGDRNATKTAAGLVAVAGP